MFSYDIQIEKNKSNNGSSFGGSVKLRENYLETDLQYEIYAKYIQLSKQQIALQEIKLMQDTDNFLKSLNISAKLDLSKDASSTMENHCYNQDFDSTISQDLSTIERRINRKITRKGTKHSTLKISGKNVEEFLQILSEIECNCSQNTYIAVRSLIQDHKKTLIKMMEVQKKKIFVDSSKKKEKTEQQNIIIKAKLTEKQENLKKKDDELRVLKEKLNQYKVEQKENTKSCKSSKSLLDEESMITNSSSRSKKSNFLPQYLDIKQLHINQRMTKIQQIQTKIEGIIESSVQENNGGECNKCCQIIKKIKESVMNYRIYLEEESQVCEKMYDLLKSEIYTLKNKNMYDIHSILPDL